MIDLQNLPPVIGVDVGGTQTRVAVLRGAKLCSRVSILTGEDTAPDSLISRVHAAIAQALTEANVLFEQVVGIGLGITGSLNSQTGVVFTSPYLPGWDHVPLGDIFTSYYNIPVVVENDANAATLGEHLFGAGCGCKNMVYLTISTGIGGGVIVDGKLMTGTSGTAAELGHMTIDWQGERCPCGNIGCLESIASGTAIARHANEAIARGIDLFPPYSDKRASGISKEKKQQSDVDARAVAEAARSGIAAASAIILHAARGLGVGLVNIIHTFNPEMIVLGGGLIQIGPMLLEPALQIVRERAMRIPYHAVRIVQAQLDRDAGIIGAGVCIYRNIGAIV